MMIIDGSRGEGGGQMVRTSLSLSVCSGVPIRIENIRARRPKPGLLRQHLTAVNAAGAVCGATVEGAALGSQRLTFTPGAVRAGDYTFAVGTAGSVTLVLQAVLPPLLTAAARSTLTVEGGTHNPWAPPYDFLERAFLPLVNRLGPRVEMALERHGFYPAGGGRFIVTIEPSRSLARLDLLERGELRERRVTAMVAGLPPRIAEREVSTALHVLDWPDEAGRVMNLGDPAGPGNIVLVEARSDNVTEITTGFGQRGKPAEAVAMRAAEEMRGYLAAGVPVGEHLADQLLTLLAFGDGGSFRTSALSLHARTNIDVIQAFNRSRITTTAAADGTVRVDLARV